MITIKDIAPVAVIPGFTARFVHTDTVTLAYWDILPGSRLPVHKHLHEQITQVEEGSFELTVDAVTQVYTKGMVVVIPSMVEHGGVALTACKLFDIFTPVREDYKALQEAGLAVK
ncbi:cupin domain-containing protein [Chitinophaga horti]|uniref:Cupin domain-containing protein n=1 Tax=Chitinophaga horti TaxID=2920382 RepID=A0ABY6J9J6_9BACT|nr:cupin domain-containing protein [Chitinophaga horti]UYQ95012.1 cupin domain-containing protein [Chitinophaga horti]